MPIVYKWSRQGSPMPLTSKEEDHNRILTIEDLQLEDSGTYTCTASRGTATRAEKSYHLVVEGKLHINSKYLACTHTHTYTHTYTHIHIHTYTCTHTYIHTYTHIRTHTLLYFFRGARFSSVVRTFAHDAIGRRIQPVLHNWCNKGRGMCYAANRKE